MLRGHLGLSSDSEPAVVHVDADVLFLEPWKLERGGYQVLFFVLMQIHPTKQRFSYEVQGGSVEVETLRNSPWLQKPDGAILVGLARLLNATFGGRPPEA